MKKFILNSPHVCIWSDITVSYIPLSVYIIVKMYVYICIHYYLWNKSPRLKITKGTQKRDTILQGCRGWWIAYNNSPYCVFKQKTKKKKHVWWKYVLKIILSPSKNIFTPLKALVKPVIYIYTILLKSYKANRQPLLIVF